MNRSLHLNLSNEGTLDYNVHPTLICVRSPNIYIGSYLDSDDATFKANDISGVVAVGPLEEIPFSIIIEKNIFYRIPIYNCYESNLIE